MDNVFVFLFSWWCVCTCLYLYDFIFFFSLLLQFTLYFTLFTVSPLSWLLFHYFVLSIYFFLNTLHVKYVCLVSISFSISMSL